MNSAVFNHEIGGLNVSVQIIHRVELLDAVYHLKSEVDNLLVSSAMILELI